MGEVNFYYFTCLKSYIMAPLRVSLSFLFVAFAAANHAIFENLDPASKFHGIIEDLDNSIAGEDPAGRGPGSGRPSGEYEVPDLDEKAVPCSEEHCQLPECFCSGTKVPKDLPAETIPQFIMLTFDDAINPNVAEFYDKLFRNRSNPNGCPIRGTFYITHEWNDYWLTKKLYSEGHEIADHTITHESTDAFKRADIDRWTKEIGGMKKILEIFGQVKADDIRGFRAPYLQPGGDLMFEAMARCGIDYDTSLPAAENNPPMWPYTLNYASTQECKIGPCPKNSHKGLWEVPMVYYNDEQTPPSVCAMIDACHDNGTKQSAYDLLLNNFLRHYLTNRAPFPMFMHAGWFTTSSYRWEALNDFIDTVLSQPDVYFVTPTDVIDWMKNPVPCEDEVNMEKQLSFKLREMNDWSCKSRSVRSRAPVCSESQRQNCVLKRVVYNSTCERRFSTCFQCPSTYPWLGNPDGNLFDVMEVPIPSGECSLWSPPRGIRLVKPKKEVRTIRKFSAQDARNRLLKLLQMKLKDNNVNKEIMSRVMGNNN